MRTVSLCLVGIVLLGLGVAPVWAQSTEDEVRLGREYARRLESQYRLVQDAVALERLAHIGGIVAAASDRPTLPYAFKIIDLDVPNALSLPGGFIYVTKGLLSFARSDHELAAVLGHEIAHAAHRHQLTMINRSTEATFWTLVVAILSREPAVGVGAQLMSLSLLSGYTRDLEKDADLSSISYLVKTPYTPVAVLTLMESLARAVQLSPRRELGALRDHPTEQERVEYITADLRRRGIPLVRRVAANYLPVAAHTVTVGDQAIAELLVNGAVIVWLPDPARIATIATQLDQYLNTDPDPGDITSLRVADGWEIVGGRTLLMTVTNADAAFLGVPVSEAAGQIQVRLQKVIREDLRIRQFTR
jgi:Zn-dependent protease with chaperone function